MNNKLIPVKNSLFSNSTVLITGAGGTIGSALLSSIKAKTIIAVDISEYAIYKLHRANSDHSIKYVVGDISDAKFCSYLFKKYQIDYVFNAAAYKHVDMLQNEDNTYSVIKNNIMSAINLCNHSNGVKSLIHISSDKAVHPTNVMGYTKLWCERIMQHCATTNTYTTIKIVRFGNVYNSAGSFIETLRWQVDNNLPITITDNRMKRYFMTVNDAVCLINDIVSIDKLNSTYILEMGEEINIVDLVNSLNTNSNPIKYIGARPGEKFTEELTYNYESLFPTSNPLINRIDWNLIDMTDNINQLISELNKEIVCPKTLSKIITTTTIL